MTINAAPTPPHLTRDDKQRIIRAATVARRLHPGPIGDFIADELQWRVDEGRAIGPDARTWRLVTAIEDQLRQREETT